MVEQVEIPEREEPYFVSWQASSYFHPLKASTNLGYYWESGLAYAVLC